MKGRELPRWSRHHESWCAIFRGKPCDCDDDRPPQRRRRPLSGGGAPAPEREKKRELEEV
jgi:hypothetical protein